MVRPQAREHRGPQKLIGWERLSHEPVEGVWPADTLMSESWLPELQEDEFLSSQTTKFVGICYVSPRK